MSYIGNYTKMNGFVLSHKEGNFRQLTVTPHLCLYPLASDIMRLLHRINNIFIAIV